MSKNLLETLTGFIVIAAAVIFGVYSYNNSQASKDDQYVLHMDFDRIDGIIPGSEVQISGIKVGSVKDTGIDNKTFLANVKISVSEDIKIPKDSSAEIVSSGLLGDKYIAIVPGGNENFLKDGDEIKYTQPSISIESLIGKFMFGSAEDENQEAGEDDFF